MSSLVGFDVRALLASEAVSAAAGLALQWSGAPWQAAAAVALVLLLAGTLTVKRHSAAGWVALGWRWLWRRKKIIGAALPSPVDTDFDGSVVGVRLHAGTLTSMIAVAGSAHTATFLERTRTASTTNTVPMSVLAPLVEQFGLAVGIEVVSAGQRRAMTGSYAALYEKIIGTRPVAAQRRTWLILRVDVVKSIQGLTTRKSLFTALAAATERCARQLDEAGCRARPCTADDILEAEQLLLGPGSAEVEDRWSHIQSAAGNVATYVVQSKDLPERPIERLWIMHANAVAHSVHLKPTETGPQMAVSVRVETVQHKNFDVPEVFSRIPGEQARALRAARASAESVPHLEYRPAVDLNLHAGPSGVLLGRTVDEKTPFLLPLTDPLRSTTVSVAANPVLVRQYVLRAEGTGERIAVYTPNPMAWANVGRSSRIWIAPSPQTQPPGPVTMVVADGVAVPTIAASTVINVESILAAPEVQERQKAAGSAEQHVDVSITEHEHGITVGTQTEAWEIEPVYYADEANFLNEPTYV
ncbi:type VII secretion protein EccE [Mycobacteroides chelonae]|uniref:Type VII secretion protein EccE n=1 Tax=Mycobacteroides chelonae TaxID=1774 RepID=A0A1S1LXM3_MYCCH|nr:type VII secretion protein EccE [Mycobacteroides chelonae]OHU76101.1 type VII secretion protein EccE [Mycobacteroides chelonae]